MGETVSELYDKLSLRERVGQVFIWTYSDTRLSQLSKSWMEKYPPGGLIAFGRNIQNPVQIAKYNRQLQAFAKEKLKAPLFLMVDQEGGSVTRLRTSVPLPSALALGKVGDAKFIESFAKASADVLTDAGFNFDLAPVLDLSNPERDTFIGNRAFGEDPDVVSELGGAFALGISEAGMIPTVKHYPGHGGVSQDSHHVVPRKLATYDELADRDLVPFEEYAENEFPKAVMMAHLALPNIDPSALPATYSQLMIQEYLRKKLKFDGLIITDDLEMNGASIQKDFGERAIAAFLAGNDMLMLAGPPSHQKRAFEAFLAAAKSGRVNAARLKESVDKILSYKLQLVPKTASEADHNMKPDIARLEALSREVLKKNFKHAIESGTPTLPQLSKETAIVVLSSDRRLFETFKEKRPGKVSFFHMTEATLNQVPDAISKADLAIFYASGIQTARWLESLDPELRAKTLVINANHSGEVASQNTFIKVLNINSPNPDCGGDLAEFIQSIEARKPATEVEDTKTKPAEDSSSTGG